MQLASRGARGATHSASNFIPRSTNTAVNSSRSIHLSSYVRVPSRVPTPGTAQKLFTQSRNLLAQFFTHLTAPGLRAHSVPSSARSLHGAARSTIQQGFSFPTRVALGRPLQSHFLPRAPAVAPRAVTQVGLGTARNFSSARPIFQNLVENIPVAGRAFYEADWEIKMQQERDQMMQKPLKRKERQEGGKELLKPKVQNIILEETQTSSTKRSTYEAEMEHYFPAPTIADVTTCLLVPLAPTPTSRVPLPAFTSTHPSLLPLPALTSLHSSHATHTLRVSSLFSRLDAANVWERGVLCSAYSHGAVGSTVNGEGVCTILKVEFVGWTKAEVRGVIGESGTGWCVLEEFRTAKRNGMAEEDDDLASETSSIMSGISSEHEAIDFGMAMTTDMDPAKSFVLPTLDFSSSFVTASSPSPASSPAISRTSSDMDLFSYASYDSLSDTDSWSDPGVSDFRNASASDISTGSWVEPPSTNGWFGFSSEFARRAGARQTATEYEPRESIFY